MAVVAIGNSSRKNCYKVPGLIDPILDTHNISYLEDRYVLGDQLGWGQFGVIRICNDTVTGETLACKSIAKDRLVSPEDVCSVKLEIDVMARLSGHPNIVDLKAVYEEELCVHLVMELCAGGELFHQLEKHGQFPEPAAAVLFRHLMEVVLYCHDNGIVHRDLKPENILLANKSSSSPIKLADFGLATYIKPGQSLNGTVGSPFYIAPEVLAGGYNEAADVWSAGVILYILLSGMPPFWGKTKSMIFKSVRSAELQFLSHPWDGVSQSAKELVTGMLCRDPTQRLTAKQVLEHSWIDSFSCQSQASYGHENVVNFGREENSGSSSFSMMGISTSDDVSFGFASPDSCNSQPDLSSLTYTCRLSFSTVYNDTSPFRHITGFSYEGSCESSRMGFSSPVPTMPTFSFFSRPPSDVHENLLVLRTESSNANTICRDPSIGKLFVSPDPGHDIFEHKESEFRRGTVSTAAGEIDCIRSKRNHTIGLGESLVPFQLEHLCFHRYFGKKNGKLNLDWFPPVVLVLVLVWLDRIYGVCPFLLFRFMVTLDPLPKSTIVNQLVGVQSEKKHRRKEKREHVYKKNSALHEHDSSIAAPDSARNAIPRSWYCPIDSGDLSTYHCTGRRVWSLPTCGNRRNSNSSTVRDKFDGWAIHLQTQVNTQTCSSSFPCPNRRTSRK